MANSFVVQSDRETKSVLAMIQNPPIRVMASR